MWHDQLTPNPLAARNAPPACPCPPPSQRGHHRYTPTERRTVSLTANDGGEGLRGPLDLGLAFPLHHPGVFAATALEAPTHNVCPATQVMVTPPGRDCHALPLTPGRMAPSLPNSSTRRDQRHRAGTSCSRPIVVGVPLLHPGSAQRLPLSNLPLPRGPPAAQLLWSQVVAQTNHDLLAAHNRRNDADTQHAAHALLDLLQLLLQL
jgi:hypothetical protein